ncbi:MAG: hypothetical protein M4579_000710 [Chaenotheca gracillima]|nr:MAG: hypothetical protein M4579_000710 [Chaenotheca gracillima]
MPLQPLSSGSSRARKPSDKSSREATANNSKSSRTTAIQAIDKKLSRSPEPTPPQSPPSSLSSLYSHKNVTLDELPAWPESTATSPAPSFSQRQTSNLGAAIFPQGPEKYSKPQEAAASRQPIVEDVKDDAEDSQNMPVSSRSEIPADIPSRRKEPADTLTDRSDRIPDGPSLFQQDSPSLTKNLHSRHESISVPPDQAVLPIRSAKKPILEAPSRSRTSPAVQHSPSSETQSSHLQTKGSPASSDINHTHYSSQPPPSQFYGYPGAVQHYPTQEGGWGYHHAPQIQHQLQTNSVPPQFVRASPTLSSLTRAPPVGGSDAEQAVESQDSASPSNKEAVSPQQPASLPIQPTGWSHAINMGGAAPELYQAMHNPAELTQRIQSTMSNMASISAALPDLHQLLTQYHGTRGQMGAREESFRENERQQTDTIRQKGLYIESLTKQLEGAMQKHSSERSKLHQEISNVKEKLRQTAEKYEVNEAKSLDAEKTMEKRGHELETLEARLRDVFEELAASKKATRDVESALAKAEQEKLQMQEKLRDDKANLSRNFQERQKAIVDACENDKRTLRESLERRANELDETLEKHRTAIGERVQSEVDKVRAESIREREELSEEAKIREAKWREETETLRMKERDSLKIQLRELQTAWDEERLSQGRTSEEKHKDLVHQHSQDRKEAEQMWKSREALWAQKTEEEKQMLRNALEESKGLMKNEQSRSEGLIKELRGLLENLSNDKQKLQHMVEAFGEITDIKSKGDLF